MFDLEYELRFALSSKTLRIHSIEDISKPDDVAPFKKRYNTAKTIFQFITKTDIPIKVPLTKPLIDINEIDHELLYCEIAIGESIYATEDYALNSLNFLPPVDYDTFITTSTNIGGCGMAISEGEVNESSNGSQECINDKCVRQQFSSSSAPNIQNLSTEDAYYVVKDVARIRPLYRIKFEYDHALESSDDKLCESCYAEHSVCFCYAERAQLCDKCDKLMHYNELTRRHQRHYFNEENTKFIHCALHSQVVDFWCLECEAPVCTYCKIKGNHSMLPDHNLISYKEAWSTNLEVLNSDNSVDNYISDLEANILEYQTNYEEFIERVKELKELIKEEYRCTINKIDQLQSKNYGSICKKYLEKKADLENIRKMKIFRPNNFLNFFKAIKEQRSAVKLDLTHIDIEPIKVTGGFKVNAKCVTKREGVRPKRMSSDFYFESVE